MKDIKSDTDAELLAICKRIAVASKSIHLRSPLDNGLPGHCDELNECHKWLRDYFAAIEERRTIGKGETP